MTNQDQAALRHLNQVRTSLNEALIGTMSAADLLVAARNNCAGELAELIVSAIAYCERLHFVVLGDVRADQATLEPS